MEKSDIINAHEEDADHFCACGEEKNPDFPKCFACSKKDREGLEDWVRDWGHRVNGWEPEPF